jgi:vacuolar-type H+-ATPase subunit C/Vma6
LAREAALGRLAAMRMTRAARRAGRWARAFVARLVDLENAWSLLAAPEWGRELAPSDLFIPGGQTLDEPRFTALAKRRDRDQIMAGLANQFAGTPFERVFANRPGAARLERDALEAELAFERRESRLAPLGPAVFLNVCQRIRVEARDLRAVIAGLELGAPLPSIGAELVTA